MKEQTFIYSIGNLVEQSAIGHGSNVDHSLFLIGRLKQEAEAGVVR
jgi:hypothetical protein